MSPTALNRVLLVLSYAGLFVAGILSEAELFKQDVPCGTSHGCAIVAAHPSSHLLGFPNAYLGFFGYLALVVLATYRELAGVGGPTGRVSVYAGYALAAFGTLASLILTFISITEIHATCMWCLSSAVIMTLTLLLYMVLALKVETAQASPPSGMVGMVLVPVLAVLTVGGLVSGKRILHAPNRITINLAADDRLDLVGPDAHIKNPNGVVTLVEFGDLVCPTCKHAFPQVEQMVDNSNGKLKYVFHNFPLYMNPEHVGALPGAVISEIAAEKGKFWEYLDKVYGGPERPNAPAPSAEDMISFGVAVGLDEKELRRRLPDAADPARLKVMADLKRASKYRVTNTPTFIVMADGLKAEQVQGTGIFEVLDSPEYKKRLAGN